MSVLLGDLANKVFLHQLFLSLHLGSPLLKRYNTREQNILAKIPHNYKSTEVHRRHFQRFMFPFCLLFLSSILCSGDKKHVIQLRKRFLFLHYGCIKI